MKAWHLDKEDVTVTIELETPYLFDNNIKHPRCNGQLRPFRSRIMGSETSMKLCRNSDVYIYSRYDY